MAGSEHDIQFLVDRKFPDLARMRASARATRKRETFETLAVQLERGKAEKYRQELKGLLPAELDVEVAKARREDAAEKELAEARHIFNQPHANANLQHWSRMLLWDAEQSVALSFGKEPAVVTAKRMEAVFPSHPFATRFLQRLAQVHAAIRVGQLTYPMVPTTFLAWCKRMQIEVAPETLAAVDAIGLQVADWKTRYDELAAKIEQDADTLKQAMTLIEDLRRQRDDAEAVVGDLRHQLDEAEAAAAKGIGTRERESILKLVIGMAVAGYKYDPSAKRSDKVPEIVADLERLGVGLSDDTVRKYLKEAGELLPPTDHGN